MKKTGLMLFMLICMFAFPGLGHAAGSTNIYLDGKALNLPKNGEVQNVNGNIMIPIRVVVEELGFNVNWEKVTRTVTIKQADTTLKLVVGEKTATVNGNKMNLLVAPILKSDTTLVPLRFIGEQFGLTVHWDNAAKTAYLVTPGDNNSGGNVDPGNGGTTEPTPPTTPPVIDENLASIGSISFSDNKLMIATDKKVSPNIFKISGPERIVIDVPNTKFADTFSNTQILDSNQNGYLDVEGYPAVSKIRYSLYSSNPSTIRFVIDLNQAQNYKMTNENDGLVIIDLNSDSTNSGRKLVVIDAGHGGSDPGAISTTKKKEKDFNLAVTLKVEQLLKKETQFDYVLTRSGDTYPSLKDRVKIAEDMNADIFISIHANAGSATASGVETYYTRKESLALANVMHKYLVASSGLTDRKVRTKSLHVTRETTMPAVLLECGYLSNPKDDAILFTESFQNNVAEGIVKGIKEYLGIQ